MDENCLQEEKYSNESTCGMWREIQSSNKKYKYL